MTTSGLVSCMFRAPCHLGRYQPSFLSLPPKVQPRTPIDHPTRILWLKGQSISCKNMVRFKNRWILVEFIPISQGIAQLGKVGTGSNIDGKAIWAALKQSVLNNFGDTGWGAVGLSLTVKYFSPTTNICIIRVARDQHNIAWGALTLLTAIEGARYIPNVIHVSGTIKHAQLAAIAHNREIVARYRALAKNPAMYQDSYDVFLETSELEIEAMQD